MVECPGGSTGSGLVCVDLTNSGANCGTCNRACGPGFVCNGAGHCAKACAAGYTRCPSVECTDLNNDPLNCGACGLACAVGASCQLGRCACPSGDLVCTTPQVNPLTACVDPASDPLNCGGCGKVCTGGAGCVAGQCICPAGEMPCAGVCVLTATDPENCGGCGQPCASALCVAGACAACPSGQVPCNGRCVDLQTDAANCGACGAGCENGTCAGGACSCPPAMTLCTPLGCGAEVNSETNCGAAGASCALGQVCVGSSCQTPSQPVQLTPQVVDPSETPSSDGQEVFFVSGGPVEAVPIKGGATRAITTVGVNGLAIDATNVYWTLPRQVWREPLAGGPATLVFSAPGPDDNLGALAVTSSGLYFGDEQGGVVSTIAWLPTGASASSTVWDVGGSVNTLVAQGGLVYAFSQNTVTGAQWLSTAPETGGGWPMQVDAAGTSIESFAVSSTGVYFTHVASADANIYYLPQGGGPAVVAVSGQPGPTVVAADDTAVYWFNAGDGSIRKQSLCGGTQVILARGQIAQVMSVDAQNLYWGSTNGLWVTPK
jgi:hypothetical protein